MYVYVYISLLIKKRDKVISGLKWYNNANLSLPICSSSYEHNMPNILHYDTLYFLRYTYMRYMKYLLTNIQKQ